MTESQRDILTGAECRIILGIDPGISGCIAALDDAGRLIDFLQMPTMQLSKGRRINAAALAGWIRQLNAVNCYFEKVGAMPGQGVSSTFSFGHSAGIAEGIVATLEIPLTHITPQAWKKTFGLIGKDKDAARSRAVQLYPECRELDLKGRGQALADAILIARHGLEKSA